jgi:ComF family protein
MVQSWRIAFMPIPLIVDSHQFSGWPSCGRSLKLAGMFGSGGTIVNRRRPARLTAFLRLPRGLARLLAATVLPPRCCLCAFPGASLDLDLCVFCRADLPWLGAQSPGAVVAMRFARPVDDLIRELKYHGVIANARVLGVLLAQAVQERGGPLPGLLVPVPLHDSRLRERGFNQAAALARYAGRMLGVGCAHGVVRRVRDTPSQTSLSVEERYRNVRGAFAISGARARALLDAAGHVAIVDDVMTTGSTVEELKHTLLAAGVRQVDVWAVARVSADRPGGA